MAHRFKRLFQLPANQYIEGAPVILVAGVLSKDNETGSIITQLKFQSVSEKRIKAVKVSLAAYDVSNADVQGVSDYQYLELNIGNGQEFGSNKAIVMPVSVTRSFAVASLLVVFNDGSMWESPGNFAVLPAAKKLSLGGAELVKQYRIATNDSATCTPAESQGLWQCACGTWNKGAACTHCRILKNKVFSALDVDVLKEQMNIRLAKEQEQRDAETARQAQLQAEADARRKKNMKLLTTLSIIALIAAILIVAGIAVYNKVTEPTIEKMLALYTNDDVIALLGNPDEGSKAAEYDVSFMGEDYSLTFTYGENTLRNWTMLYSYPGVDKLESIFDVPDYNITAKDKSAANAVISELTETFREKYGEPQVQKSEENVTTYTWVVNDRMVEVVDYTGNRELSLASAVSIRVNCDHQSFCEHTDTRDEHLDATCTGNGYDRTVCNICDYVDETILEAFGHNETSKITKEASCSEAGERKYICKTCGNERMETLDMVAHKYQDVILKEAACTENGLKKPTCSVCGYCTSEEPIAALGHAHERETTKAAGCETEGTYTYTCSKCSDSYTEKIPALGHSMSAATCTKDGKCSRCGKIGARALGHNWAYKYWNGSSKKETRCERCQSKYTPNIRIIGKNLPYSEEYNNLTIESVYLDDRSGVFIDDNGEIIVAAWITLVTSGDDSTVVSYKIYNSSGTLIEDWFETVSGWYNGTIIANLPDGDTYYIVFD